MTGGLGELIPDRYELNARTKPALLALLPLILLVAVWVPVTQSAGTFGAALLTACGITYLLAQLARSSGRRLETRMGDAVGRRQSARMLSHFDDGLRSARKARIAALLDAYGPGLPTEAEELEDSVKARERRLDAIDWLLEATRPDAGTSMLLAENIAYGFRRNLCGLKPVALVVILFVLLTDAFALSRIPQSDPRFLPGFGVLLVSLVALAGWVLIVTRRWVIEASHLYAERLFAQVDNPALLARLASK